MRLAFAQATHLSVSTTVATFSGNDGRWCFKKHFSCRMIQRIASQRESKCRTERQFVNLLLANSLDGDREREMYFPELSPCAWCGQVPLAPVVMVCERRTAPLCPSSLHCGREQLRAAPTAHTHLHPQHLYFQICSTRNPCLSASPNQRFCTAHTSKPVCRTNQTEHCCR